MMVIMVPSVSWVWDPVIFEQTGLGLSSFTEICLRDKNMPFMPSLRPSMVVGQ